MGRLRIATRGRLLVAAATGAAGFARALGIAALGTATRFDAATRGTALTLATAATGRLGHLLRGGTAGASATGAAGFALALGIAAIGTATRFDAPTRSAALTLATAATGGLGHLLRGTL